MSTPGTRGPRIVVLAAVSLLAIAAAMAVVRTRDRPAAQATGAGAPAAPALIDDGVVAYYFHTTARCPSCRKIEAWSRLAVETGFDADLAAGKLQFRAVNIEEDGNQHFAQDYQLYTKSLILSERREGREVRWKNLTRVWELLGSEQSFVEYVQGETHAFMDAAP